MLYLAQCLVGYVLAHYPLVWGAPHYHVVVSVYDWPVSSLADPVMQMSPQMSLRLDRGHVIDPRTPSWLVCIYICRS